MLLLFSKIPFRSHEPGTLPERCDRAWFVRTFCTDPDPGINSEDKIWPFVRHYQQYDALAALAASSEELLYRFFNSTAVSVGDATHRIISLDPNDHGVRDPVYLPGTDTSAPSVSWLTVPPPSSPLPFVGRGFFFYGNQAVVPL